MTDTFRWPCGDKRLKGEPSGYLQWPKWAAKKMKTHKQLPCPRCQLYHIWVKRT